VSDSRAFKEACLDERMNEPMKEPAYRSLMEERFHKAFHKNPAGMVISDVDTGVIFETNESFCRVYGFSREQVIGKSSLELNLWHSPGERARLVEKLKRSGGLREEETIIRTRSGQERHVSLSTEFLELAESKCVLSILVDITERKRTEEKLRYHEQLQQQVLKSVPGGVVFVDKSGAVREANPEAQTLLGLSFDQLTHSYISDFGSKTIREDGSAFKVEDYPVAKCLQTREPQPKATLGVIKPDGSITWAVFAAMPVFEHENKDFLGVVVTFLDVTARKQAEDALRESEQRFRQLAENINEVFWMYGVGKGVLYVSPAYERIWGRTCESLYQDPQSYLHAIHPHDMEIARKAQAEHRGGHETSVEYRVLRPDGSMRWVRDRGFPIFGADGKLERVVGVAEDVTEYRHAIEAMQQSERRYRTLAETTGVGIWQATLDGKTIYANPAMCAALGVPDMKTLAEHKAHEFFTPESLEKMQSEVKKRTQGGASSYEVEVVRADGRRRNMLLFGAPFEGPDGKFHSLLATFVDITFRRHAEQALQVYAARLRYLSGRLLDAQEAERRHIARELHDEIGQTLTAVKLNLQAAKGTSDPKHVEERLLEGIQLVEKLLEQVRNLSLDLCPPQLDFFGLVPTLRSYLEEQAKRAGLQSHFFAEEKAPRLEGALEIGCFRVAQEAMTNVIRHAKARSVSVRLLQDAEALHLYVRDDGAGFDFRAARQRATQGECLGLVGMEERVALLGGKMTIDSRPGHGTELHAWFPLKAGSVTAENTDPEI
jgi:PAS domain S-box-containing protein